MLVVILIFILGICSYCMEFSIGFGTLLFKLKSEVMGNLLQPMAFERLYHAGCVIGYQKELRSTYSLLHSLLATPGCWISFLFSIVICEFPFNEEPLIISYSKQLAWYFFIFILPNSHIPLHL